MKNALIAFVSLISAPCMLLSQVQIDKPIELNGATGERMLTGLEDPVNETDATNKRYVDSLVTASSGSSDLIFSLSSDISSTSSARGGSSAGFGVITIRPKYESGISAPVVLSLTGAPSGVSWNLSPGGGYPSYESKLVFYVAPSAAFGTYPITVSAIGPNSTEQVTINLNIIPAKRIFLSSTTSNGNLGGISGADNHCQSLANAQSLGGTWKAWISSSTSSAASRFTQSVSDPYVLLDGTLIANNWADLTDGSIYTGISLSETGVNYPTDSQRIFTNTNSTGGISNPSANHCSDWTSTSGSIYGNATANGTTNWWGQSFNLPCDGSVAMGRLYCFEQ